MSALAGEAVGEAYRRDALLFAQQQTWRAVHAIGERVAPGVRESELRRIASEVLASLGAERRWHPDIIRIGANTCLTWKQKATEDATLGDDDICFVDLGAVWQGHEGDAGASFVVGNDATKRACAEACLSLWQAVAQVWREHRPSGRELYAFAQREATAMGWALNHDIKGHRVGDFPHAIHRAPALGALGHAPSDALWILEIQIRHPTLPFGAFHEDLLAD